MTNEQIREILARRDGFTPEEIVTWQDWKLAECQFQCASISQEELYTKHLRKDVKEVPDYLNSVDAIRGVLLKLTGEEWERLLNSLDWEESDWGSPFLRAMRHCLTIEPETLARLVAEALTK